MNRPAIWRRARTHARGFSYIEVLVATVIMAISLPAALEALRGGTAAAGVHASHGANQQRIASRMEEVLANKYPTLDAAAMAAGNSTSAVVAAYSDASGAPERLVVNLYRTNGVAKVGADFGLLWVKVSIEGSALALQTLAAR